MKKRNKKISLKKETIRHLSRATLSTPAGGSYYYVPMRVAPRPAPPPIGH